MLSRYGCGHSAKSSSWPTWRPHNTSVSRAQSRQLGPIAGPEQGQTTARLQWGMTEVSRMATTGCLALPFESYKAVRISLRTVCLQTAKMSWRSHCLPKRKFWTGTTSPDCHLPVRFGSKAGIWGKSEQAVLSPEELRARAHQHTLIIIMCSL